MTISNHIRRRAAREEGAVLVHVAISLLALCGFAAFAVDWGVFWVSRSQAQNSADAGAMAGAVALAYDDVDNRTDSGPAKRSALRATENNWVWGQAPNVNITSDVTFPACPDGSDGCIRVDVHRSQARGNALPVFFGSLIGLVNQSVRATATAQAMIANATTCLKPWAIPDRWEEHYPDDPGIYDSDTSKFQTMTSGHGNQDPVPLLKPDQYRPPSQSNTTGFRASGTPNDIGTFALLKGGNHNSGLAQPGWVYPIRLNATDSGGADYQRNITQCSGDAIKIGDNLRAETENGVKNGPTDHGIDALIAGDPNATWYDPDGPGGVPGKVVRSCAQSASCPSPISPSPTQSPRVVAVALFDPSAFVENGDITIVNIVGFFIVGMQGKDVRGYLTQYPGMVSSGGGNVIDEAAFSRTVTLVR